MNTRIYHGKAFIFYLMVFKGSCSKFTHECGSNFQPLAFVIDFMSLFVNLATQLMTQNTVDGTRPRLNFRPVMYRRCVLIMFAVCVYPIYSLCFRGSNSMNVPKQMTEKDQ